MNEYLIRTTNPSAYPKDDYRSVIVTGMLDTETILDILHPVNPILPGDQLIGGWDRLGEQIEPFDQVSFEAIRPLGNNPPRDIFDEDGNVVAQSRGGDATQNLLYHHFSGWGQRKLGSSGSLYPDDNMPFPITIKHKYFSGHADPNHDGWGWRAEMHPDFVPTTRDPAGFFINIYTDPRCRVEDSWYNAAGFSKGLSEWYFDGEGNPIEVWQDEYDQAYLGSPDKAPVHYGVCQGSIHNQQGYSTLQMEDEEHRMLFWEYTQPVPGGDTWVDTGAVIIALAGTLYRISDVDVVAALVPGQSIRLGDTGETTFVGVWAGGEDYIEIDPYVSASVGDALWVPGGGVARGTLTRCK